MDLSRYVMRAFAPLSAITAEMFSLPKRWIARMSWSVTLGLLRTRSKSSSVRVTGKRWMTNESVPASLWIASFTDAFRPWIRDTTAMIDVTATMLPSTVMKDASLDVQIEAIE